MHSSANIEFPVVFTEENSDFYSDRKIIYSLQVVQYLRKKLPDYTVNIITVKDTEIRFSVMSSVADHYEYESEYRMKLLPKPTNQICFLTGRGKSACKGIDNFINIFKEKDDKTPKEDTKKLGGPLRKKGIRKIM